MNLRRCTFLAGALLCLVAAGCSADSGSDRGSPDGAGPADMNDAGGNPAGDTGSSSDRTGGSGNDDARGDGTATDGRATSDANDAGTRIDASTDVTKDANVVDATRDAVVVDTSGDGNAMPPGFWDTTGIPAAKNVMVFKFLNRTNGKYTDGEVYWSFKSGAISETHSIAEQPTYDMPANSSGRMYFYICAAGDTMCASDPTKSKYYDF
ncbi:MAG: hypothetical protein ABW133_25285, partial [Polyangiaceae bacterium]